MKQEKAYYHLPGSFEFYELYREFLPLFRTHREYFYDWCAVDRADVAPVIKVFSVRPEQGQELPVQLVELEQSGQMIVSFFLFHFSLFLMRFAS